jgi:hypothetical protein
LPKQEQHKKEVIDKEIRHSFNEGKMSGGKTERHSAVVRCAMLAASLQLKILVVV